MAGPRAEGRGPGRGGARAALPRATGRRSPRLGLRARRRQPRAGLTQRQRTESQFLILAFKAPSSPPLGHARPEVCTV